MSRITRHAGLGIRWGRCGWRLFQRNPWLLIGMGSIGVTLIAALALLPFIGAPLIGLLAPALLASFYLTLDHTAKQKLRLPSARRFAAIKQAPRELTAVFRDESRAMQVVMLSFYCMVAVVLADILLFLAAGSTWAQRADLQALPRLVVVTLATLCVHAVIAASLIYTLPLALLEKAPLVPAMRRSMKASGHYGAAFVVPALLLFAPVVASALASRYSVAAGYVLGLLTGALAMPLLAASLYCSFRTLFPLPDAARVVRQPSRQHRPRAA